MEKWVQTVGYENLEEFFIKFAVPIFGASFAAFLIVMLVFDVPVYVPYGFLLFGIGFIFAYPYIQFEQKKVNIHENIHLFITYAGTISTLNVNRAQFFRKVAEQKQYGEISDTCERIVYLAKEWNLGFAATCRKLARFSPSTIFADFLDRMAAVLDFGEDLEIFLSEEQDALMADYANEYKQSLENIKMLQDMFISLTIAIAFALSAALLLPLLMGVSIIVVVQYGLLALIFIDVMLIMLIKMFIPADRLSINLGIPDEGQKRISKWLYILAPISIAILASLAFFTDLQLIYIVTAASAPLLIVGIIAIQEENVIFSRDKAYPPFIRAVGGTIYVRGGGVTSALGALQVHDFGVLQPMMTNLHRRLLVGTDKIKAWLYFSAETGSALIYHFTRIFYESIYLGGNGEKIGKIISDNFSKLLNLRKLRLQLASSMRGALYGGLVGFVVTVYMAATITDMLAKLFGSALSTEESAGAAAQLFASILPAIPPVDINLVTFYIGIMVIVHAIASSLIIKVIDGGKWEAMFFDFVIMLAIGSGIAWVVPKMSAYAFGSILLGTPAG
jgi:archaeal flagellar protein FlaJ